MLALVSTVRSLLLVDLESGKVEPIEDHRGEYYGISWFPGKAELVLSHSTIDNSEMVDIAAFARSEVGFLSIGNEQTRPFLSTPHQILCAPDGGIITTNTGRNRVQVFYPSRPNAICEVGLSAARWDRFGVDETPGDHLNSLFLRGDRLHIVAHGFDGGSRIADVTYPDLELVNIRNVLAVTGMHNIFIDDEGAAIACHSIVGGLVDPESGDRIWSSGSACYTRGLAISADHIIVGASEIAPREKRATSSGGLYVLERASMKTLDYVHLGPFGAVNEVRLADLADLAHHGTMLDPAALAALGTIAGRERQLRLARAGNDAEAQKYWHAMVSVFGHYVPAFDGWRTSEGGLNLAMLKGESQRIAVNYRMVGEGAHVGLSPAYGGSGGDTNMEAFLLRSRGRDAALGHWIHDGAAWRLMETLVASGLPVEGAFSLSRDSRCIRIFVNDAEVATIRSHPANAPANPTLLAKSGGDASRSTPMAVRWMNASVRPVA